MAGDEIHGLGATLGRAFHTPRHSPAEAGSDENELGTDIDATTMRTSAHVI